MPSKQNLFHSHRSTNRSDISVASQNEGDAETPHSTASDHHHDEGLPYLPEERGFYQLASGPTRPHSQLASGPTRSHSHRLPTLLNTNNSNNTQPSISLHSTPNSAVEDDNPDRYYQQPPKPPVHKAEPKKRRFFGLGGSSKDISKDKSEKIGRSTSIRRKDQPQQLESHNIDVRNRTEQQSSSNPLDDEEESERYVPLEEIAFRCPESQ